MGGARAELEGYDTILTRWEFGRLLDQPNVLCDPRCRALMNNKHNSHNEPTTVEVRVAMGVGDLYYGGCEIVAVCNVCSTSTQHRGYMSSLITHIKNCKCINIEHTVHRG